MEAKEIKKIVEDAVEGKIKDLYINCEHHHADHQKVNKLKYDDIDFLIAAREFVEALKDTFWKTLVRALVVVSLSVVTGGIYAYFRYKH
jgi:hypothetical protein|tara:strand:+ start:79 stop:345 length:267 start_codon:yes stop_codon:yes gene_type:complete